MTRTPLVSPSKSNIQQAATNPQPQPMAAKSYPQLPQFVPDSSNPRSATTWLQICEIKFRFFTHLTDADKVGLAVSSLDPVTFERVARHLLPADITTSADWKKFKDDLVNLFDIRESMFAQRYNAFKIEWRGPEYESIHDYISRIRETSVCFVKDFSENEVSTLRFLMGMKAPALESIRSLVLNALITKPKEDLAALETLVDNALMTQRDQKLPEQISVAFVKKISNKNSSKKSKDNYSSSNSAPKAPCPCCGGNHWKKDCKWINATCYNCNKVGHIAKVCKSEKKAGSATPSNTRGHGTSSNARNVGSVNVYSLGFSNLARRRRLFMPIAMCNVDFSVQLDIGSDISIITRDDYQKLGAPTLSPPQIKVKAVGNMKLELDGYFVADVTARGTTKSLEIYVADVASALLGLDFWHSFDLQIADELLCQNVSDVPIEAAAPIVKQLHTKFAPLFREGLGCCTKKEITLQLKPNAKRVVIPARRLSILASAVTKKELDRLLDLKIIRPYIGPVEYATPGSTVKKKDGGDRFVVDFSTGLNDQLEESSYQLPVPEEIFAKLVGAKYFSRLDMKDGYYQLKVSEESKRFLIISTPFGYFQYERAAMGLKPLPGDFQQIMDEMLAGLSCAAAYLDDVFIFSETEAEHRRHIEEVLARIMQWGFLLNLKKCIFFLKSVRFLGRVIDAHGIRPDPEKIAAVQSMPDPTNVSTLRSFLGLVNYYQYFVPMMRDLRQPLDELLKQDNAWKWNKAQVDAVANIKKALTNECMLTHFDPRLPIIVAADASQYGIGGCIAHRYSDGSERPIMFFSRALNVAQEKYSQTEKEGLALVMAVKVFHRYLEGRRFTLLTDHRALLSIFGPKKQKPSYAVNRLHRWSLFLAAYNFDILYKKTTEFGQADALSRLIADTRQIKDQFEEEEEIDETSHAARVVQAINLLPVSADDIKVAYENDQFAQDIFKELQSSNPKDAGRFSIVDGIIQMNDRVYVPELLRPRVLQQLHSGHAGISRTKALARQHCYWPRITKDIEEMINRCYECVQLSNTPTKTTLASWPISDAPGQRIHLDFAGPLHGKMVLIAIDSYSKWIDAAVMSHATAVATVKFLFRYCADNGMPHLLVTDNGSQFTSAAFQSFCLKNGIRHMTSPVYHPQSNGQAEKMVDVYKRFVKKKFLEDREVFDLDIVTNQFLYSYRTTPNTVTPGKCSPAKVHLGRELRTILDQMRPQVVKNLNQNVVQNEAFDRHHGAVSRYFKKNEAIFYRLKKDTSWKPGIITSKRGARLYFVLDVDSNKTVRVHANQLKHRMDEPVSQNTLRFLCSPNDFDYHEQEDTSSAAPSTSRTETSSSVASPTQSCASSSNSSESSVASSNADPQPPAPVVPRYPQRNRKQTTRLKVNPKLKSYN